MVLRLSRVLLFGIHVVHQTFFPVYKPRLSDNAQRIGYSNSAHLEVQKLWFLR